MTEPPRPPGAGDPGAQPDPSQPSAPGSSPTNEPPTAPLSGASAGAGYPPPGGYPPPSGDQPPSGGYPPPGAGYPGGGAYGPPRGYASNDDRTWALVAHFGGPVGVVVGGSLLGWVAPLIALSVKGQQSPTVRAHALAALNFQITWAIALVASFVLAVITCGFLFFVPIIVALVPIIFGIIGGVKATEGVLYRYPMSYPFVK